MQRGAGQQAVSGEQFGSADNHQHQTDRKYGTAQQAGYAKPGELGSVLGYNR